MGGVRVGLLIWVLGFCATNAIAAGKTACGIEVGAQRISAVALKVVAQKNKIAVDQLFEQHQKTGLADYLGVSSDSSAMREQVRSASAAVADAHSQLVGAVSGLGEKCDILFSSSLSETMVGGLLSEQLRLAGHKVVQMSADREARYLWNITAAPRVAEKSMVVDLGAGSTKVSYLTQPNSSPDTTAIGVGAKTIDAYFQGERNVAQLERFVKELLLPELNKQEKFMAVVHDKPHLYWVGGAAWAATILVQPARAEKNYAILTRREIDQLWDALVQIQTSGIEKSISATYPEAFSVISPWGLLASVAILRGILDMSPKNVSVTVPIKNRPWIYGYLLEAAGEGPTAKRVFVEIK